MRLRLLDKPEVKVRRCIARGDLMGTASGNHAVEFGCFARQRKRLRRREKRETEGKASSKARGEAMAKERHKNYDSLLFHPQSDPEAALVPKQTGPTKLQIILIASLATSSTAWLWFRNTVLANWIILCVVTSPVYRTHQILHQIQYLPLDGTSHYLLE
jgi:hypothetical protein